jgi:hypothetical protein
MCGHLNSVDLRWAMAAMLAGVIGCGGSSGGPSQIAGKASSDQYPTQKPDSAGPAASTVPLFPLPLPLPDKHGPSETPSVSTASSVSGAPTSSSHPTNTRPVGPFGVRQITLGLNDLRQAGALLLAYYSENNGWPRNDVELQTALREMPNVYKAIQSGDYIFVPAKNPNLTPGAQTVIIYEKLPDKSGIRLVLFGDGSVKRMSLGEFNQLKLPMP